MNGPRYLALHASGELHRRGLALTELLRRCTVCPRGCGARRLDDQTGACGIGLRARVARACVHCGEEPVLGGSRGAGTVFFVGCNLRCVFCQNHQISQPRRGQHFAPATELDAEALAQVFLDLQQQGVATLELVSPSHVVPQAVAALAIAAGRGLRLPLVYNCNGYDGQQALRLLDGVVDVYLPDLKYADETAARRYSAARGYVAASQAAVREMQRQVGELRVGEDGIALAGVLLRHLVLPNDLASTDEVLRFVAEELGQDTAVSLMAQYYPAHLAPRVPLLSRPLRRSEYARAIESLHRLGLSNGFLQDLEAESTYRPDFERPHPFE